MLRKIASVVYGVGAYLLFLGAFLYLMAFATNLVPHSVSGTSSLPPLVAALVDVALITLFGLQHGIMARPGFKRWWTRFVPPHLERSTFVWLASVLVIAIVILAADRRRSVERDRRRQDRPVCDLPAWISDDSGHQLSYRPLRAVRTAPGFRVRASDGRASQPEFRSEPSTRRCGTP